MSEQNNESREARRGFLQALGLGAGVAAAATAPAVAQTAAPARKENQAERVAARYRETDHVRAFYRTNRY